MLGCPRTSLTGREPLMEPQFCGLGRSVRGSAAWMLGISAGLNDTSCDLRAAPSPGTWDLDPGRSVILYLSSVWRN